MVQEYLDTSNTQTDDLAEALLIVRSPQQKPAAEAEQNPILNIIGPIMGGMMIFYAFYTGTATAESILREEEERTLPSLFTTPTPQAAILGGKFLAVFLTVLVQMAVLIVAARLIFGIRWGALEAVVLMALGVVLGGVGFRRLCQLIPQRHQAGWRGVRRDADGDRHAGDDQHLCHELAGGSAAGRYGIVAGAAGLGGARADDGDERRAAEQRAGQYAGAAGVERGLLCHRRVALQASLCIRT